VGPGDDLAELHAFAASIGLRRAWFQDKVLPHYDVTDTKRVLAIKAGAQSVSWRETGRFVSGWRAARSAASEAVNQNVLTGSPTTDDESGRSLIDQGQEKGSPS
jgi:hypothetical protein